MSARASSPAAAADYGAAIEHAERLGARAQVAVLNARLGSALLETGRGRARRTAAARGDRRQDGLGQRGDARRPDVPRRAGSASPAAPPRRASNSGCCARSSRIAHFVVFDAFILGAEAWLDAVDGRYEEALDKIRAGAGAGRGPAGHDHRPAHAPLLSASSPRPPSPVRTARAAAGTAPAASVPPTRCCRPATSRRPWSARPARRGRAQARARCSDEAAYAAAYAEGGGLSPEEAAALL